MHKVNYKDVVEMAKKIIASGNIPNVTTIKLMLDINTKNEEEKLKKYFNVWNKQRDSEKFTFTGLRAKEIELENKENNFVKSENGEWLSERAKELEHSLSLARATLESTTDGILVVNKIGKLVDYNQKFIDIVGVPKEILATGDEEKALQYVFSQVINPEELFKQLTSLPPEAKGELNETLFKDGRIIERYSQPHVVNNEIVGRVWSFRDVTERRRAEQALILRNRAIEASYHGIAIIDLGSPNHPIIYVNPAFERITGFKFDEVKNKNIRFLYRNNRRQSAIKKLRSAIHDLHEVEVILQTTNKAGKLFWSEMHFDPVKNNIGLVTHYVVIINDITERKKMEQQLIAQATHDALTKLPNRALLQDRIEQALLHAKRSNTMMAMVFIDLDRFKFVNDSLGHDIGDLLLKKVAQRLKKCIRSIDTISRIGGDEFIGVFPELKKESDILPIIQKIMMNIERSYNIKDQDLILTASIGVSFYPKDGDEINTLMKKADISMYCSKDNGRNSYTFYKEEMKQRIADRLKIEHDLRHALERQQFILHYQPLLNLQTGKVVGAEALIRWNHPERGMIPPLDFISLAEETGLIIPMSEWVIHEACRQNAVWQRLGLPPLRVAINMTAKQFKRKGIAKQIKKIIKDSCLDPALIELELTESILIEGLDENLKTLKTFKDLGVRIAIDDFGTGYSSLSYLKQFQIDKLKIDRSFVKDLPGDHNDTAITFAIINLAHSLNLKVLAEGVETEEQAEFLKRLGCDEAQGYHFSKPIEPVACYKYIKDNLKMKL